MTLLTIAIFLIAIAAFIFIALEAHKERKKKRAQDFAEWEVQIKHAARAKAETFFDPPWNWPPRNLKGPRP